jgi:membrane glycosyltransferase
MTMRVLILLLALGTAAFGTTVWADLLGANGLTGLDRLQIALFAITFGWLSLFFWSALLGWALGVLRIKPIALLTPREATALHGKPVAIVVPVYNEDAAAVAGRIAAMFEGLRVTGQLDHFHFFILSDTTEPDIWVQEVATWQNLCEKVGGQGRIFYRRRPKNTARKAGNLAEFCENYGARYEHMIVLDADSLITAPLLVWLAQTAQLNPTAGIIQALPSIIGSESFYARAQQFAARLYGPLLARGISAWHQGDSNYWGHNAIIRVDAFTQCCGLPTLSGKPPLGGHIMSHDFVEAALIRRGGWKVWLVSDVDGCFEQMPQSLIENGKRERRWVQGNLQHSKILLAAGLHPMSRLHLAMGILAYLAPIFGLLFLLVGLASSIHTNLIPPDYFPDTPTLFPTWPIFDGDRALQLLALVVVMLTLPKLLAALTVPQVALWGGRWRVARAVLVEHLFTILIAPVMMLIQTSFVLDVLLGRDSGWGAQNRGDACTSWREAWLRHRWHTLWGMVLTATSWFFAPALFWWLVPIIAGLLLSMPLSYYSSRSLAAGLFAIPEERAVPPEVLAAPQFEQFFRARLPLGDAALGQLAAVLDEPRLNALHLSLLAGDALTHIDPDELAKARRKLALRQAGQSFSGLSNAERMALLSDAESLRLVPLGVRPTLP